MCAVGVVAVLHAAGGSGVDGAVLSVDNCIRLRYSLMDSLRFGAGGGSGAFSCGLRRGSWLAVLVSGNFSGVGNLLATGDSSGVTTADILSAMAALLLVELLFIALLAALIAPLPPPT